MSTTMPTPVRRANLPSLTAEELIAQYDLAKTKDLRNPRVRARVSYICDLLTERADQGDAVADQWLRQADLDAAHAEALTDHRARNIILSPSTPAHSLRALLDQPELSPELSHRSIQAELDRRQAAVDALHAVALTEYQLEIEHTDLNQLREQAADMSDRRLLYMLTDVFRDRSYPRTVLMDEAHRRAWRLHPLVGSRRVIDQSGTVARFMAHSHGSAVWAQLPDGTEVHLDATTFERLSCCHNGDGERLTDAQLTAMAAFETAQDI